MRSLFITSFTVLALGACSSTASVSTVSTGTSGGTGTTTGGSGSTTGACSMFDGGQTIVTFTTVQIHPAAVAALNDAGFPVPSITQGDYVLALYGVSVNTTLADPIVLTDAGVASITSNTGPYPFELSAAFFKSQDAQLGVAGVIRPAVARDIGDGGLPQPTCAEFATISAGVQGYLTAGQSSVIPDYLLDAGFTGYDSVVDTGLEVGGEAVPPVCDVHDAIAYAIPLSYAVMLNCAGNPTKTTHDTDVGEAIAFITDGAGPGQGTPVAGASVSVINAAGNPTATYYENNYTMTDMTGTDSTGIATFLDISPAGRIAPTMSVHGVPGYIADYAISTQPNTFFSILAYPH